MPSPRAPWWVYLIAASFLGSFTLGIYNIIWGPEPLGLDSDNRNGSLVVRRVAPEGAAARAGLRTGDRIVAVDGIPIRRGKRVFDFLYRVKANFEFDLRLPALPGRHLLDVWLPAKDASATRKTVELNGTIRVSSGIMIPQNTARGTTFTITFTGKSGAIDEAATATVTAK